MHIIRPSVLQYVTLCTVLVRRQASNHHPQALVSDTCAQRCVTHTAVCFDTDSTHRLWICKVDTCAQRCVTHTAVWFDTDSTHRLWICKLRVLFPTLPWPCRAVSGAVLPRLAVQSPGRGRRGRRRGSLAGSRSKNRAGTEPPTLHLALCRKHGHLFDSVQHLTMVTVSSSVLLPVTCGYCFRLSACYMRLLFGLSDCFIFSVLLSVTCCSVLASVSSSPS